jgi:tryptophan synthase beta chain
MQLQLQFKKALLAKETGEEKVILTALCGHGHFDLAAYDQYLNGEMVDSVLTDADFEKALAAIPAL